MFKLKNNEFYVIAEIANAAQGVYEDNFKLIELAKKSGANAVKFQFYKYDYLAAKSYSKYDIYSNTFYSSDERGNFIDHATKLGLDVWVDIFDEWGFEVASQNIEKIKCIKIPPTIILDQGLVNKIISLETPVALGVGGYTDEDIDFVLEGFKHISNELLLLYGFQGFPAQLSDTVMSRIPYLKNRYGYEIGFADHVDANSEMALLVPEYAFFAGARIIEKHITLDRSQKGFDYYSALEESEFTIMCQRLSVCADINGKGEITNGQKDYLVHATRGVLKESMAKGEVVYLDNIFYKRTDNPNDFFPNKVQINFPYRLTQDLKKDDGLNPDNTISESVAAVVIARMASSRLPNKAIIEIGQVPAINRCIEAVSEASKVTNIIFATSTNSEDDILVNLLNGVVETYRGSDNDPALRIYEAASKKNIKHIIRITGDTPLILPDLLDELVNSHLLKKSDYSFVQNAPLGVSAEIFTIESLEYILTNYETEGNSEYLSLFFKNNDSIFKINAYSSELIDDECINYRFNLDYPEDYKVIEKLFQLKKDLRTPFFSTELFSIAAINPKIMSINSNMKKRYDQTKLKEHLFNVTTTKVKK